MNCESFGRLRELESKIEKTEHEEMVAKKQLEVNKSQTNQMMDDQVNMDIEMQNLTEIKNVLTAQNLNLQSELEGFIRLEDDLKN